MEISKLIPKWVELKGKIWPNSITEDNINEAPLIWSVVEISRNKNLDPWKFHISFSTAPLEIPILF